MKSGNYYYVEIAGLYAQSIQNVLDLKITNAAGEATVLTYGPYTYAKKAKEQQGVGSPLFWVLLTMADFSNAAADYLK